MADTKTYSLSKQQIEMIKPVHQALVVAQVTHDAIEAKMQATLSVIAKQLAITVKPNESINMSLDMETGKLTVDIVAKIITAANMGGVHDRPAH